MRLGCTRIIVPKRSSPPIKPMGQKSVCTNFSPQRLVPIEYLERRKIYQLLKVHWISRKFEEFEWGRKFSNRVLPHHESARSADQSETHSTNLDLKFFPIRHLLRIWHHVTSFFSIKLNVTDSEELLNSFEIALSSKSSKFFEEAFFKWRGRAERC